MSEVNDWELIKAEIDDTASKFEKEIKNNEQKYIVSRLTDSSIEKYIINAMDKGFDNVSIMYDLDYLYIISKTSFYFSIWKKMIKLRLHGYTVKYHKRYRNVYELTIKWRKGKKYAGIAK